MPVLAPPSAPAPPEPTANAPPSPPCALVTIEFTVIVDATPGEPFVVGATVPPAPPPPTCIAYIVFAEMVSGKDLLL